MAFAGLVHHAPFDKDGPIWCRTGETMLGALPGQTLAGINHAYRINAPLDAHRLPMSSPPGFLLDL
jgi:hypothetical protein